MGQVDHLQGPVHRENAGQGPLFKRQEEKHFPFFSGLSQSVKVCFLCRISFGCKDTHGLSADLHRCPHLVPTLTLPVPEPRLPLG